MANKEAIEILNTMLKDGRYLGNGTHIPLEVLETFNKAIEALENQKTGRWIRKNDICTSRVQIYQYECSNCREINTFSSNHCPYCGAKMKGDK